MAVVQRDDSVGEGTPPTDGSDDIRRLDNHDEIMAEVRENLRAASEAGQIADERSRRAFELSERNDRQIEKLSDYIATVAKKIDRLDTAIRIGSAVIAFAITTGVAVAAIVFG